MDTPAGEKAAPVLKDAITDEDVEEDRACFLDVGDQKICVDVDTLYRYQWDSNSQELCSPYKTKVSEDIKRQVTTYKLLKDIKIRIKLSSTIHKLVIPYHRRVGDYIADMLVKIETIGRERNAIASKEGRACNGNYDLRELLRRGISYKVSKNKTHDLYKGSMSRYVPSKKATVFLTTLDNPINMKKRVEKLLAFVNTEAETQRNGYIKYECEIVLSELKLQLEYSSSEEEEEAGSFFLSMFNFRRVPITFYIEGYEPSTRYAVYSQQTCVGDLYTDTADSSNYPQPPWLFLIHMPVAGGNLISLDNLVSNYNSITVKYVPHLLSAWMEVLASDRFSVGYLAPFAAALYQSYLSITQGSLGSNIPAQQLMLLIATDAASKFEHQFEKILLLPTTPKRQAEVEFSCLLSSMINNTLVEEPNMKIHYDDLVAELSVCLDQLGYHVNFAECNLWQIRPNGLWREMRGTTITRCSRFKLDYVPTRHTALASSISVAPSQREFNAEATIVTEYNIAAVSSYVNSRLFDPKVSKYDKKSLCSRLLNRADMCKVREAFVAHIVASWDVVKVSRLYNILQECDTTEALDCILTALAKVCR